MSNSINVLELLDGVRLRSHDVSDRVWPVPEKLKAADDMLRQIYRRIRQTGEHHGLDRIDIAPSAFTALETDVLEYDLPEYIGNVELVQAIQGPGVPPIPIKQATFEDMDSSRGVFSSDTRRWLFSRYGNAGSIQLRGRVGALTNIRIWYTHSWGPLHYGTAASGTTTSITAGTTFGNFKNRPELYTGYQLEVTADVTQPTNVGSIRRIITFTGGVYTLQTALPATANSTTQYAMLIPLPPDTHTYFVEKVVDELLSRDGNQEERALRADRMQELEMDFAKSIADRAAGEPPRMVNSRMFR
jgi:hypothetical protein